MSKDNSVRFASGDPLFLFDSVSRTALAANGDELRRYPADPALYWRKKFVETDVPSFLQIMGLVAPESSQIKNPLDTITCSYGGLHGITLTTDHLLRGSNNLNQIRMNQGLAPLKPAVIAPVPTYTFPFNHMQDNGIDVIEVPRIAGENWTLKPEHLARTLEDIRRENTYHVIGFYDCNPHNPTGLIREKAETAVLAEVFAEHNATMSAHDQDMRCGAFA